MNLVRNKSGRFKGFSLIELMVSMGILSVLMLMLTVLLDQVQKTWRYSESRISQFREARVAFDLISKNIGQASLNTYWDLTDDDEDGLVDGYYKTSELHFITLDASELSAGTQEAVGHAVFFQAPLGFSTNYRNLNNLFNGRGYFAAFGGDQRYRPSFVKGPPRYRFRVMEFRPPAESNQVFEDGREERIEGQPQIFDGWYKQSLGVGSGDFESHLNPLADNIILLVISPRDSLESASGSRDKAYSEIAENYSFNSNDTADSFESFSQQVPPLLRITMIAIDESSAVRYESGSSIPREFAEAVKGRFSSTGRFTKDLKEVTDSLNENQISHKVFSSLVMLRSSKWSS